MDAAHNYEPDVMSSLLGNPDGSVRYQAVELFRTLRSEEDSRRAAIIAVGLSGHEPLRCVMEQLWPGQHNATIRHTQLRSFALDCAQHVLPALRVYAQRPNVGFAGQMPDLSNVQTALRAAHDEQPIQMKDARACLEKAIGACRRWSQAATRHGGPVTELQRALAALRAVRHVCSTNPLHAARYASWAAQKAAADPSQEAEWQRGWLVCRLLGAPGMPLEHH